MLARQLIGGFSSLSLAGHSSEHRKIDELALSPPNTGSHFIVKIKGRKKVGRKTVSGSGIETVSL